MILRKLSMTLHTLSMTTLMLLRAGPGTGAWPGSGAFGALHPTTPTGTLSPSRWHAGIRSTCQMAGPAQSKGPQGTSVWSYVSAS